MGIQNVTLSQNSAPVVFRFHSDQDIGYVPEDDEYVECGSNCIELVKE